MNYPTAASCGVSIKTFSAACRDSFPCLAPWCIVGWRPKLSRCRHFWQKIHLPRIDRPRVLAWSSGNSWRVLWPRGFSEFELFWMENIAGQLGWRCADGCRPCRVPEYLANIFCQFLQEFPEGLFQWLSRKEWLCGTSQSRQSGIAGRKWYGKLSANLNLYWSYKLSIPNVPNRSKLRGYLGYIISESWNYLMLIPFSSASTLTKSPSLTRPSIICLATSSKIACWIKRLSGRAP